MNCPQTWSGQLKMIWSSDSDFAFENPWGGSQVLVFPWCPQIGFSDKPLKWIGWFQQLKYFKVRRSFLSSYTDRFLFFSLLHITTSDCHHEIIRYQVISILCGVTTILRAIGCRWCSQIASEIKCIKGWPFLEILLDNSSTVHAMNKIWRHCMWRKKPWSKI